MIFRFGSPSRRDDPIPAETPRRPLRIAARGMCCAVGHNAPAATAAMNARLNHFRETGFVAGGMPLNGGTLYELDVWGAERLLHMLQAVLDEVWAAAAAIDALDTSVVLTVQERERPGWSEQSLADVLARLIDSERLKGRRYADAALLACGKGGIADAMQSCAVRLYANTGPKYVLLASVDSLLNAGTIEHYLSHDRLLTHTNTDGMIPGEGAAAILLDRSPAQPGVWIDAVAVAHEPWRIDGQVPMRAQGLTQAIRAVAVGAGCQVADLDFHVSGMTGESWYAKEVSMALSRSIERRMPHFPHLMIAGSLGETGAASPALALAWMAGAMERPETSPGRLGLLHFSGDDGRRSAMIIRAHS